MIKKKWHYLLTILSLTLLGGCTTIKKRMNMNKQQPVQLDYKKTAPPITIWVHGTKLVGSKILPSFFHCQQGLHNAYELDNIYRHRIIANTLSETDPERFPSETFYLFGWSGALNFQARKQAAKELYESLKKLVINYEKHYHQKPFIRMITHSHGGNVALNLSDIKDADNDIVISELILLACPVQNYTKNNIQDPIFGNIISLYSTLDALQVLDPQGIYPKEAHEMYKQYEKHIKRPLFSQRVFISSNKVIQAKIKMNHRGIFHVEFLVRRFLQLLPKILDTIEAYKKQNDIHTKPILLNLVRSQPISIKEMQ